MKKVNQPELKKRILEIYKEEKQIYLGKKK